MMEEKCKNCKFCYEYKTLVNREWYQSPCCTVWLFVKDPKDTTPPWVQGVDSDDRCEMFEEKNNDPFYNLHPAEIPTECHKKESMVGEIRRPPDNLNPDKQMEKAMKIKRCPFCNSKDIEWYTNDLRVGTQPDKPWYKTIFEKAHTWERKLYRCRECKAEFYTKWYPLDISEDIDWKGILSEIEERNNI